MNGLLEGKNFLVTGAANSRSIAWAVALAIKHQGGSVAGDLGAGVITRFDAGKGARGHAGGRRREVYGNDLTAPRCRAAGQHQHR